MPYLLDSNIFIQAKNLHYSFDFCPAFWEWLDVGNEQGKVFSIEKVRDELIGGDEGSRRRSLLHVACSLGPRIARCRTCVHVALD